MNLGEREMRDFNLKAHLGVIIALWVIMTHNIIFV